MSAELRPDDEVTDWLYQWQGPDGAESWWPAMPFVHAQVYLLALFPAFALGLLLAWGFGTGLISRVLPVLICMGVTWLVVSEWVKHVDSARPIAWHRAVLRSELRSPRPLRKPRPVVVSTSAEGLLAGTQPVVATGEPGDEDEDEAGGAGRPVEHPAAGPGAGAGVLA